MAAAMSCSNEWILVDRTCRMNLIQACKLAGRWGVCLHPFHYCTTSLVIKSLPLAYDQALNIPKGPLKAGAPHCLLKSRMILQTNIVSQLLYYNMRPGTVGTILRFQLGRVVRTRTLLWVRLDASMAWAQIEAVHVNRRSPILSMHHHLPVLFMMLKVAIVREALKFGIRRPSLVAIEVPGFWGPNPTIDERMDALQFHRVYLTRR
jgi:hypothetical protein